MFVLWEFIFSPIKTFFQTLNPLFIISLLEKTHTFSLKEWRFKQSPSFSISHLFFEGDTFQFDRVVVNFSEGHNVSDSQNC
jgi:hypothetical protein